MSTVTIDVRVRYAECDPMGYVHHSVYPVWFEMARTELLRQAGVIYAEVERRGEMYIVVARLNLSFRRPARYDDELTVTAKLDRAGGAKIEHRYEVRRGEELLCTGQTTLACVDRQGRPMRVPEWMGKDSE